MKWIVVAGAGLVLSGCMTQKTTFQAVGGQESIVRNGQEGLISSKAATEVAVVAKRQDGPPERPSLVTTLCNRSSRPITFRYGDVTAFAGTDGKSLPVWNREQLQQQARTNAIISAVAGGVASAAAVQMSSPTYSTPAANAIVDAGATASGSIAASGALARGAVDVAIYERTMLADNTVLPGECLGGLIIFEPDIRGRPHDPRSYEVRIPLGPDVHQFKLTIGLDSKG